ncbi:hypothetical protein ACHAQA_008576 [Verticillium albo-atrum]
MKPISPTAVALLQLLLATRATADDELFRFEYDDEVQPPQMNFDLKTIKSCTFWYNNYKGETCEDIRDSVAISPETFHRWNPSITLDCGNWQEQSYCIEVRSEWTTTLTGPPGPTSTTDEPTSSTVSTTTPPLGTPTWEPIGCYLDDDKPEWPTMAKRITPDGGDSNLTIEKCQKMCFDDDWEVPFVGLEGGNSCWCSTFVSNDMAEKDTDCNIPCTGNAAETCGGKNLIFAYEAKYSFDDSEEDHEPAKPSEAAEPSKAAESSEPTETSKPAEASKDTTAAQPTNVANDDSIESQPDNSGAAAMGVSLIGGLASFLLTTSLVSANSLVF